MEIVGIYSCRKYNPVTNKFKPATNIAETCELCDNKIVDVRQIKYEGKLFNMHEECIKVKFGIDDIKHYMDKVCKTKTYKNNMHSAREMAEGMTYKNRLKLIEKLSAEEVKKHAQEGDVYCLLSKELLRIAIDEGFNFYYDDFKEFYKE